MFKSRSSGFYTGSFSNEYIVPNTPFLPAGDLDAAMQYYCSQDTFDPSKCAMLAQNVGERIGVISASSAAYSGLLQKTEKAAAVTLGSKAAGTSKATIAAALYAISNTQKKSVCEDAKLAGNLV